MLPRMLFYQPRFDKTGHLLIRGTRDCTASPPTVAAVSRAERPGLLTGHPHQRDGAPAPQSWVAFVLGQRGRQPCLRALLGLRANPFGQVCSHPAFTVGDHLEVGQPEGGLLLIGYVAACFGHQGLLFLG